MTPTPYKPQPTTTGYYWMRTKWARKGKQDVVFFIRGSDRVHSSRYGQFFCLSKDLKGATFHGPLVPPAGEGRKK